MVFSFQLPKILVVLQKGVQSMIIGTTSIPDWFAHGIQRSTLTTSFPVSLGIGFSRLLLKKYISDEYSSNL